MRECLMLTLCCVVAACGTAGSVRQTGRDDPELVGVVENTRTPVENLLIGASNIWESDYTDDKGQRRHGKTGVLSVTHRGDRAKNQSVDAYEGLVFAVGEYQITVIRIDLGDPASMVLRVHNTTK